MITSENLETLIASKKREIEREKRLLGLSPAFNDYSEQYNKENEPLISNKAVSWKEDVVIENDDKQVNFREKRILGDQDRNEKTEDTEESGHKASYEFEEDIPPDLERYIRRYIGIPAMLKAGEYSPNHPLLRGAGGGDAAGGAGGALLGLGEYERRRNTLRKIRQAQYRQHLDQQAKKKQEAKEQAERERREQEEKERQREERDRQVLLERDRYSPERRRASVCSPPLCRALAHTTKVDTGVQVDGLSTPLSVAVQTDDIEMYRLPPSPSKCLTQAERELSPRTVAEPRAAAAAGRGGDAGGEAPGRGRDAGGEAPGRGGDAGGEAPGRRGDAGGEAPGRGGDAGCKATGRGGDSWRDEWEACERRRSYGDFDERTCPAEKSNREKLAAELRHSYSPSPLDAAAAARRRRRAEEEAAARRQFYQQELKNQILEQQRIREERNNREKMLERAEMRRLEEHLRMLRVAQDKERDKHRDISAAMKDNAQEYETKRTELQQEIDLEQQKIFRASSQPNRDLHRRYTDTSKSDPPRSNLPFYYQNEKSFQPIEKDKKPYSFNIPDASVFSADYDVDSYLRKNLNFRDKMELENENRNVNFRDKMDSENEKRNANFREKMDSEMENRNVNFRTKINSEIEYRNVNFREKMDSEIENRNVNFRDKMERDIENIGNKTAEKQQRDAGRNIIVEKALIHEPKQIRRSQSHDLDNISIPVLRHSPKSHSVTNESPINLSEAMKKVDDKWKVPAVQKNILKSLPNEEGKNVSILTQLGSIRRQLQLEQMKLDKMLDY